MDETEDEVTRADVMGEIAEEGVAERVVAEILNGAAAVGVGVSFLDLRLGEVWEALEQEWANRLLPREIDKLLVGLDRVGKGWPGEDEQQEDNKERYGVGAVEMCRFPVGPVHKKRITGTAIERE